MTATLLELAEHKFGKLSEGEERLFTAVVEGRYPDFSSPDAQDNDPATAEQWSASRVLKSDRIAWLATDPDAARQVTHRGIGVKGARIDGRVDLQAANIEFALYFDRCALPAGINLLGAEIHALNLSGCRTGRITADGMKVEAGVFLRAGCTVQGRVRLLGASIGGNLDCQGGVFLGGDGEALGADGIQVAGSVLLNHGFRAVGEVRLLGAKIGANLDCEGGIFFNPAGDALAADRARIEGDVFLCDGFQARGRVGLPSLVCGSFFVWRNVVECEQATLDLRSAKIGTLWVSRESWPSAGKLLLHGLTYDELDDHQGLDAAGWIEWLRRQPVEPFRPQPYEQLAAVLRKDGHDADAKLVLYAKESDRARLTKLTWSQWPWYRVFGPLIGFGYKPWRAFWLSLAVVVWGTLLFGLGRRYELMTPAKAEAYIVEAEGRRVVADAYPRMSDFMYSLDTFTPLISMDQADFWFPNSARGREISLGFTHFTTGELLRIYMWLHIIAGWILSTLLFVGLSGAVPGG